MYIKSIQEQNESDADLLISDGQYDLICYLTATNHQKIIKDATISEIHTLLAYDLFRATQKTYSIYKHKNFYEYTLIGEVIRLNKPTVCIGKLVINLDIPLPKDIIVGDFIEFKTKRLDCFL